MNKLFLASLAVASFIACDGGKTCDSGEVCDSLGTDSGSGDCTDLATSLATSPTTVTPLATSTT